MPTEEWKKLSNKKNTTKVRNYTQEGMERLAAAIVEAAVKEYRLDGFSIKTLKWKAEHGLITKGKKYHDKLETYEREMNQNRRFFHSRRFHYLCQIDTSWLLQTLDKQIEEFDPSKEIKIHKGGRKRGRI